jgi:DNA-binding beta-propeller fold protein YncE
MNSRFTHILGILVLACALPMSILGQRPASLKGLMYVGTIDHKMLIMDEANANIVGEIPLGGIPRITVLSPDQTKVYILTTQLALETVDLAARQVVNSFPLSDGKSIPRVLRMYPGRFSGLVVDPGGRYIYTTLKVTVKEIDHFRNDPPVFVKIDMQDKKIVKTIPFPKEYDDGFGFDASYKISPDGKLLYVFDDDIAVLDIDDLHQVDRIELSKPEYPGASPYRLAASDDPNDAPGIVTNVFTSVDPDVHKETLGLAKLDLATKKVEYTPLGPAFPMAGFALSPDRKLGYSLMVYNTGANRVTEWWVWDIAAHKVIKREFFQPARISRIALTSDGSKIMSYGGGSTIEFFDAKTLKSIKLVPLNKDTTTNLITLGGRS